MERSGVSIRTLIILITYIIILNTVLSLYGITDAFLYIFVLFSIPLGVFNDFRNKIKIPRIYINITALVGVIVLLSSLSLENLIKPISNTLLFLIGIKLLEEKNIRDFYQILLLSFLGISLATAVKMDIYYLLIFILEVFLGVKLIIFLNFYKNLGNIHLGKVILKRLLLVSLGFSLSSFIFSWFFFVILPRVDKPLFDLFRSGEKKLISGITEEVELGKVGEIQLDKSVVLRVFGVEFEEQPYWRVSVLDTFYKNRWIKTLKIPERESYAKGTEYTIILEPTFDKFLPLIDYPIKILKVEGTSTKFVRFKGGFYEFNKPISKPVRIKASFSKNPPKDKPLPIYTYVPKDIPKSIVNLAKKLSKGAKTPKEKIMKVQEFFQKEGFRYSLTLDKYEGNPLEYFLFVSKRGNCEYFASSTAILLRLMGVPSRLVTGFYGAIKNEYGRYYIVVNAMAHVWVEAYDGSKWIRVDTTPPYVPEGIREISKVSLIYDAILTFWYKNIVNFDTEKQRSILITTSDLLKVFGKNSEKILFFLLLTLSSIAGYFIYVREIRKTPENLYRKLLRKLKKYEIKEKLPEKVIEAVKGKDIYEEVKFIVRTYERYKYSKVRDKEELKEAYKLLKKM
ncbi:MAG TPA: DUF3488 domain-containing protein [Aquifex aeolicus]|nr:DUF3488 domain-containing protein [Aquifex aeolicus]